MISSKVLIIRAFHCIIILFTFYSAQAQLTVNSTMTPTQLVQNVLLGSGVTASNITYNGSPLAIGSFNGSASNIGLSAGVILASGDINTAIGPNNSGSAGSNLGETSDPDLDLISGNTTYDRSVLEFDFVPTSDTVKFRYVFGSEEYMEFVNGGVNDAFGFFISGPGITGIYSNNSKNIALIPGTTTPVTIDNVNANLNGAYYFDNENPSGLTIQYDGFTVPLTAISQVQCGETYHIKIAIADAGDGVWDSGVFLEAGSFSSHSVSIIPQISYGGSNDSTLFEGCGAACIYFVRVSNLSNPDTINLVISGTATNGVDYYDNNVGPGTSFPNQLIFPAGEDSISFCVNAVADGVTEGLESFEITITGGGSGLCIQQGSSATIYLNEYSPLTLTTSSDTTLCNLLAPIPLVANVTGGVEPYTYSWTNGAGTVANPTVNPITNTTYVVTVNDACMGSPDPTPSLIDSISVSIVTIPEITSTVSLGGSNDSTFYEGCGQACIYFVRTIGIAQAATFTLNVAGSAINGSDYTPALPAQLVFAAGQDSLSYCLAAVADGAGEATETVLVSINVSGVCNLNSNTALYIAEPPPIILVTSNDTVLDCVTGLVNLHVTATGGIQPYIYQWSNISGSVASQTVTPSATTSYMISVSDACNGNPDPTPTNSDSILVTLNIPTPIIVNAGNDLWACPDDVVALNAAASGGALPLIYSWTSVGPDTVNSAATLNTSVIATATTLYTLMVQDDCGNTQSDQVSLTVELNCLLNLPNVISPDGKGPVENETFYIENLDRFPASALAIYDRWGKKIFETSNYRNNWNGSKYEDGTYYYVLTIPPSGQVSARIKPASGHLSYNETTVGSDKVFAGFFQIVRSK